MFRFHHFIEVVWIIVLFWLLCLGTSHIVCWRTPLAHFFIGFLFPLTIMILDAQCWYQSKILNNNFIKTFSHSREDEVDMSQHLGASCAEEKPTALLLHTVTYFWVFWKNRSCSLCYHFLCLYSSPPLEIKMPNDWKVTLIQEAPSTTHHSNKQRCRHLWLEFSYVTSMRFHSDTRNSTTFLPDSLV